MPQINSLTADPVVISTGGVSTITCNASDPDDNDPLFYTWTAADGALSNTDKYQTVWTAPIVIGTYTISCEVSDGEGGTAQAEVTVWVATGPVIMSLTPDPSRVQTGGTSNVTCSALSPAPGDLTYTWSATGGQVGGTDSRAVWTAPDSTGTYSITCTATDSRNSTVWASTTVVVNNLSITSLTATPVGVYPLAVSTITCLATDSGDTADLEYTWTATSGTITGSGPEVKWTAPASTFTYSTYSITCQVDDHAPGGKQNRSVEVWVASAPVIFSLTPGKSRVSTGTLMNIVCVATTPAPGTLSYNWTATGGTVGSSSLLTSTLSWIAPDSTGTYYVTCAVTDTNGGTVWQSTRIVVNNLMITSLIADPVGVYPLAVSTVTCLVNDLGNLSGLTYTWTATSGTITGTGAVVRWTAPDPGIAYSTYGITCQVDDHADGGMQNKNVDVWVASAPVIESVTPDKLRVSTGTLVTAVCVASSPAPGPVTYSWSAASGTLSGTGKTFAWTAPTSTGTYDLTCRVTDTNGGAVWQSTSVVVNNLMIVSLTAKPVGVVPFNVSTVTCVAKDLGDLGRLTYKWKYTGGTVSGSITSSTLYWTAPDPGVAYSTYGITCQVDDHEPGGMQTKNVDVWVASGPVIDSVTPNKPRVSTGTLVTAVCVATSPVAGLTYSWTATGGTASGLGDTFAWTAPTSTGTYDLTCTATDDNHITVWKSTRVVVNNLIIVSLTAKPPGVVPLDVSTITCAAKDLGDLGRLTYKWKYSGGTVNGSSTTPTLYWVAPDPGVAYSTYGITCQVEDGEPGGLQNKDVEVWVASGPVIDSVTPDKLRVSTGTRINAVCVATSPAAGPLLYEWTGV
ncbi:MAG: hypothetical protein NTY45_15720 [Elusimicrobia bacterium]|nr:hypothetical protein [Elusimicrobiota bacterium]